MIVLTGGAGFIGSCFLKTLNDKGIYDILVVDHLGTGEKWKNLVGKRFLKYENKSDFRERLKSGLKEKPDAIVHLGACSDTTERDADYMLDNNFSYSVELARYCAEHDIRFIYASSAATYGAGELGYSDNVFRELRPMNIYGFSKQLFDLWVLDNKLEKTFTGLKYFNVFGPNEYHKGEMASMVYKSFNQIQALGSVRLFKSNSPDYPDGGQLRDFVYVKDVCGIMWKILNKRDLAGIYNLGTGEANTWNTLVGAVFDALGKERIIQYIEMPENLKSQYQNFTQADMKKMLEVLPDIEFLKIHDSIGDYVESHLLKTRKHY